MFKCSAIIMHTSLVSRLHDHNMVCNLVHMIIIIALKLHGVVNLSVQALCMLQGGFSKISCVIDLPYSRYSLEHFAAKLFELSL